MVVAAAHSLEGRAGILTPRPSKPLPSVLARLASAVGAAGSASAWSWGDAPGWAAPGGQAGSGGPPKALSGMMRCPGKDIALVYMGGPGGVGMLNGSLGEASATTMRQLALQHILR